MPWILMVMFAFAAGPAMAQTDGVLLPAKDYQKLLDELKARKPLPPSVCRIHCELKRDRDRPLAVLTVDYEFRTAAPNCGVLLGGLRTFAVKAAIKNSHTPVLESTADGLVAWIDEPGEHSLQLTLETAITPRGAKGDTGLDISLPRSAITTLSITTTPNDLKKINIGTRLLDAAGKPGEIKTTTHDLPTTDTLPLGATDLLDLSWETAKAIIIPKENSFEADVITKVNDAAVETTALLTLRGPLREWTLTLPAGAELTGPAKLTPPEPKKRDWKVLLPPNVGEVALTATLRIGYKESKSFSVGPYFAAGVSRQSGTLKLAAPPTLRLIPRPAPELRRADSPFDNDTTLAYRFSLLVAPERKPAALMDFEVRPAQGFLSATANHKLSLTRKGWKLTTEYRFTPVRTEADHIQLEWPAGWQIPVFAPPDLVEDVTEGGDGKVTVRLAGPQREPFELIMETLWPLTMETSETLLPFPKLISCREREAKLSISSGDEMDVTASVHELDGGKPSVETVPLTKSRTGWSGTLEPAIATVNLTWKPAVIPVEVKAETTLGERQLTLQQSFKISIPEGVKSLRFQGPPGLLGFCSSPALDPLGGGRFSFTPAAGQRELNLTAGFAVPWTMSDAVPVPFLLLESGRGPVTVSVWNATAAFSIPGFHGHWRQTAPELTPDKESWPVLMLTANEATPLSLTVKADNSPGRVVVERTLYQWWISENGSVQGRVRYLLRRWPAVLDVETHGNAGLTALLDGTRLEVNTHGEFTRLALPEAKAGRSTLLLELRFNGPTCESWSRCQLNPPRLRGAIDRQPARWQINLPESDAVFTNGLIVFDTAWRFTRLGITPLPAAGSDDLDQWLADGRENSSTGENGLAARQSVYEPVAVFRIPKLAGVAFGFVVWLLIAFAARRFSSSDLAYFLGAIALLSATAYLISPQPLMQFVAIMQPGLAFLVFLWLARRRWRSWIAARTAKADTFTRTVPMAKSPSTAEHRGSRSKAQPAASP